jgi:LPXTG-site transpeptidase (sortase) family protein
VAPIGWSDLTVVKSHRFLITGLVLVALGALAGWAGQSWRSSSRDLASATVTETVPAITLAALPARVPSQRAPMPGSTLTPTLYVLSAEPTIQPLPTITPTPAPTVDYGVPGATGRVEIPAIGVDQVIIPVSWQVKFVEGQPVAQWDTVDWAAGHNVGSAPIGGPGNTVLTGHTRGNGDGEFQNLWDLNAGDEVHVWDSIGREFTYVVESVNKVQEVGASLEERQENAQYMMPTDDTRLTLITCWPEWVYTHRIIVIARPA